jgi:hypothetical protein
MQKTSGSEYASGTVELMQPPLAQGGCISLVLQERASHKKLMSWTKRGSLQKHGMVRADAVKLPYEDVVKQSSKWTSISGSTPLSESPAAEATRSQTTPCKCGENDSWTQRILSVTWA